MLASGGTSVGSANANFQPIAAAKNVAKPTPTAKNLDISQLP
jgi:hypothetical protein